MVGRGRVLLLQSTAGEYALFRGWFLLVILAEKTSLDFRRPVKKHKTVTACLCELFLLRKVIRLKGRWTNSHADKVEASGRSGFFAKLCRHAGQQVQHDTSTAGTAVADDERHRNDGASDINQ
jgi:hypothetical protein